MSKLRFIASVGAFMIVVSYCVIPDVLRSSRQVEELLQPLNLIEVVKAQTPKQVWSIGIFTGSSPFQLSAPSGVRNPAMTAEQVTDLEASLVAHPFLSPVDSRFYMFFTVKNAKNDLGEIGLADSDDGLSWRYRQIILKRPYHLAYPYVFEWQGDYYMIPEGVDDRSVCLYKAMDFPTQWTLERVLLRGDRFISASVIQYKQLWWMFVGIQGNETLRLYYADQPTGPWVEHPLSPIVEADKNIARPGGRPMIIDGSLYRLGQDCYPTYGYSVSAFEVRDISRSTYSEKIVKPPIIEAAVEGWAAEGMHHVDAHRLEAGGWLAAVDGFQTVR